MFPGALAQQNRSDYSGSRSFFDSSNSATFFTPEEDAIDVHALVIALITTLQTKGGNLSDEDINVSLIIFLFDSPNLEPNPNGLMTPVESYRNKTLNKLATLDKNIFIDTLFTHYSLDQYDMAKLIKPPGVIFGPSHEDKQQYYGNLFHKIGQLDSSPKEQLFRLFHLILGKNNYLAEMLNRSRMFNTEKTNTIKAVKAIVDIMSFNPNSVDENDADCYIRASLNPDVQASNGKTNSCSLL